jgi:DNA-binding NtrC family response regulator
MRSILLSMVYDGSDIGPGYMNNSALGVVADSISGKLPKLLVVDDDITDLELAVLGLERQGFRVKTHHIRGDEDLTTLTARVADKGYALILSDTIVGNHYGPDHVAKAVQSSGVDVPVVGWSGTPNSVHETNWKQADAVDFFQKPIGLAAYRPLAEKLKTHIGYPLSRN